MPDKPNTADGYGPDQLQRVRATCLYVATKLGDLMDEVVVVGGLVPSLLIDQDQLPPNIAQHAGTMDLDLGLAFTLIGEQRYQAIAARLREADFAPDDNAAGNPTRQRWRIDNPRVTVDFLIEPDDPGQPPGSVFGIEGDLGAVITPGLSLAFEDQIKVPIEGITIRDEKARREMPVCGPGAYVVLKALAFDSRGASKDAYDLFYVIRNYSKGIADVAARLRPLLKHETARTAIRHLRSDFLDPDALGPRRVAEFLHGRQDANTQADVVGFVRELLEECEL